MSRSDAGLPEHLLAAAAELEPFDYDPAAARADVPDYLLEALRRYVADAHAANTVRAYTSDWARFAAWCTAHDLQILPATPETVALYLVAAAEAVDDRGCPVTKAATLTRWAAAINTVHRARGYPAPGSDSLVRQVLRGIRRARTEATGAKKALLLADLKHLLRQLPAEEWPTGVLRRRDRFILLAGFAGAFRRSELASLDVTDIALHHADGLHIRLRRSKTDQNATGRTVALPYGSHSETCPVCAYLDWRAVLDLADRYGPDAVHPYLDHTPTVPTNRHTCRDQTGATVEDLPGDRPLFRPVTRHGHIRLTRLSPAAIAAVVQRHAARAGLNPDHYAGHSLRAGFVTQAARNKAPATAIMRQTGHKSYAMVDRYIREADPLAGNAVTELGL